jgi:hypothetical protein
MSGAELQSLVQSQAETIATLKHQLDYTYLVDVL